MKKIKQQQQQQLVLFTLTWEHKALLNCMIRNMLKSQSFLHKSKRLLTKKNDYLLGHAKE